MGFLLESFIHQAATMNRVTETPQTEFLPRQCTRRKVHLQFHLGGVDVRGEFFEEVVVTHDISECGGSFSSIQSIPVGSTLKLADTAGFLSLIRIAWSKPRGSDPFLNYGFSFVHPLDE